LNVIFKIDKVVKNIGEGAFGEVFKVKEKNTGKFFAAKEIFQKNNNNTLKQTEEEILRAIPINSPYLVKFIECVDIEKSKIIILEMCERGDLRRIIDFCKQNDCTINEGVLFIVF
jgi:serine/threonine protein kinase